MGSVSYHRPKGETDRDHLQREVCGDHLTILESSTIRDGEYRVFYGACRINDGPQAGEVIALVVLQSTAGGYYNYCRKEMTDDMGPCYYDAPAKVLDLLTPTDSEYANEWREKCRQRLAKKAAAPKVTKGCRVRFAHPLSFTNGTTADTFTLVEHSTFRTEDGYLVRIPSWRSRAFELVGSAA